MRHGLLYLVLYIILGTYSAEAGNHKIDSLLSVTRKLADSDTNKVNAHLLLCDLYQSVDIDSAFYHGNTAFTLSQKQKHFPLMSVAENKIAFCHYLKSQYPLAMEHYRKSLDIAKKGGYKRGIGVAYNGIGMVFHILGDFPMALEYYLKNLKIKQEMKDKAGIASVSGNIGMIYNQMENNNKAMEYFLQSYSFSREVGNKKLMAGALNNMGSVFADEKETKKALQYYLSGLRIREELGEKSLIATSCINVGSAYQALRMHDSSLFFFTRALEISAKMKNKRGIALAKINIGLNHHERGNHAAGIPMLLEALEITKELGLMDIQRETHRSLVEVYRSMKNFEKTIYHLEQEYACRDSLMNSRRQMEIGKKELQFEYAKQMEIDSIRNIEQKRVTDAQMAQKDAENKKQKIVIYAVSSGMLLLAVLVFIAFSAYRQKQKANRTIAEQKRLVEEKQKDILDSIQYAKRIQKSLLASEKYVDRSIRRLKDKS